MSITHKIYNDISNNKDLLTNKNYHIFIEINDKILTITAAIVFSYLTYHVMTTNINRIVMQMPAKQSSIIEQPISIIKTSQPNQYIWLRR